MTTKTDGVTAFPQEHGLLNQGMSLRQYAAIHLCVPDSGTNWLDDMIRERMHIDVAAKVAGSIWLQFQKDGTATQHDNWRDGVAIESMGIAQRIITDAPLAIKQRRENKS